MNEQLSLLIQIQEIDGRIHAHQAEKKRIPEQLAELDRRIEESKAGIEKVREALEEAQKARRDRDRDLEAGGQKVEKLKARASEIKTNKEYQALLKEIETAEQESKAIEDDILRFMERIDGAAGEITAAERLSAEESAAIEEQRKQLQERITAVSSELAAGEQERKALAARIEYSALAEYERLACSKSGKVVVEVRGESCAGCYMSIPPKIFVTVKKNDDINSCPNCHRILYYKEMIAP